MAALGQIGIYWGTESFSVVETINEQITNILQIPFDTTFDHDDEAEEIPDKLKFPTILKKTFEFRSIKTKTAHLSLPTAELIFRSFVIPQMDQKEIENVIEFEITKYIPIKLEELTYTYHTIPHKENNQKKMRVLFIAIRKTKLEKMTQVIQQAGLTLTHIEPAPISLIHLLKRNKSINKKETTAILQIGEDGSEIFAVKDDTLTFMRKLNVAIDQTDLATLQSALQNEIRVSFNFYNRQNQDDKINKIIILSQHKIPDFNEALAKEFNIPIIFAPIEKFIPIEDHQSILHLNALGTTLRKQKYSPKFFDLSEKSIEMQRSGKNPLSELKRYSIMCGIIIACIISVITTILLGNNIVKNNQKKIIEIENKLGAYKALSISDLTKKKEEVMSTLKAYTNVQITSSLSTVLSEIPKLLPEGTWLTSFKVNNVSPSSNSLLKISLSGKIYSPDQNQQFYLLNEFIDNLKTSEVLAPFFKNVKRNSANQTIENNYPITTFTITCD